MKMRFIQTITKSEKIIIQKCVVFVNKYPSLKKIAIWFIGFSPKFRQRLINKLINEPVDIELSKLTEDARAIYLELQSTIEQHTRVTNAHSD
jgi:hypothetical protein